ncbi:MAG: hypothetical protein OSJ76_01170 [Alphaproteobacteria bacterium]|nr:hypothetical protein [Alphaproteobacteria bacterium]
MSGWVKLHRSLLDWEWYGDINVVRVFIHLLLKANYEERQFRGEIIPRGTLLTTWPQLVKETGLTVQQARTAISKLKSTGEITVKLTGCQQAVTVVKYNDFQNDDREDNSFDNNLNNSLLTGCQRANNRLVTAFKESKEVNNLNNIYNNPPLTPQDEGEKKVMEKAYAFEGEFVKLNRKDFNRWKEAFPNVELEGFLTSYDAWLKTQPEKVQKEWYMRCSGYLAKKNQENARSKSAAVSAEKSQKSEETIWELYDRIGIPYTKPEEK